MSRKNLLTMGPYDFIGPHIHFIITQRIHKLMTDFQEKLKKLTEEMVHDIYRVSTSFPKSELYGAISQIRRAALSVALNYTEGFARKRRAVNRNFVEIAYGSLQETKFLVRFAEGEKWLSGIETEPLNKKLDEIGRMLWGISARLKNDA